MEQAYPTRSLRELARVLFSRLVGIIVILVVVIAAVVAATLLSRWRYRSRSLLLAKPMAPLAAGEGWTSMKDRISAFIVTQRQLIKSDHVVASALMKMAPDAQTPDGIVGPDKQRWYTEETVAKYAAGHVREIADCLDRISVETPGGPDVAFTQTFNVTVDWPEQRDLAKQLGEKDSRAFAARQAHEFATLLVSAYRARRSEIEARSAKQRREYLLDKSTALAKQNLESATKAMVDFVAEKKLDVVLAENMLAGGDGVGSQSLSTRFQVDISTIEATIKALDTMAASIAAEFAKGTAANVVIPEELLKANPSLGKKLDAIADLGLKLNNLTQQYTEDYEQIRHARAERAANMADLKQEVDVMIRQKRATEQARLDKLQEKVAVEQQQISDTAAALPRYKQLKAGQDNAQEIFNTSEATGVEAQGAQALAAAPVELDVVDAASRPDPGRPYRPIFWLNIVVGAIAGLILSLIYAFVADHYDHSLKGMGDVERYVGIEVLASIPKFRRSMIRAQ